VHVLVAILGLGLLALLLVEFFVAFLLPRRVKRDPQIARGLLRMLWTPWRAVAARLPTHAGDTMLGIFGPLGLLTLLLVLSAGVVVGYAGIFWASGGHLGARPGADFGDYLYFSAGAFFSASTPFIPVSGLDKALQVVEAANGFAFLAIAIGYLPALFQAFSRRETAVSRLDPRAGSPPTVAALLERSAQRGGWPELDAYLREWETWTAELMETHLSYPILGYFRSQHVGQNWLAALTTVVDACAYAIAYGPHEAIEAAELTFRIGRHALADLAFVFDPRRVGRELDSQGRPRLSAEDLRELRARLENSGLHSVQSEESADQLGELRSSYEPYAIAIAGQLRLALPDWLPADEVRAYWRLSPTRRRGGSIA
jgi:hypothetical protein